MVFVGKGKRNPENHFLLDKQTHWCPTLLRDNHEQRVNYGRWQNGGLCSAICQQRLTGRGGHDIMWATIGNCCQLPIGYYKHHIIHELERFFLWKLIQAVFLKWHSVSNVHHVQFSLFMNSKGCVFSQERSRTKICLICIPGKAWQVTWEKIGSQGKRFQPIRGKERPRGEGNQPIRSILDIRSVFADFLKNVNHIGFMWIIGWKGLNMAGSTVGAML